MTDTEVLALIRLVLCLIALPFAVRGRYWWLVGVLIGATVVSTTTALGLPRELSGLLAVPMYGLLVAHTLDVTRRRRIPRIKT